MKKTISIIFALMLAMSMSSCRDNCTYTVEGLYYSDGTVITSDGNAWEAYTDDIKDDTNVIVTFDDNGTPDNIYDDIIISID